MDRNYDQAYFPIRKLDAILSEMLAYYESIPALSIAMSQGGDFLGDNGGHASWVKRKGNEQPLSVRLTDRSHSWGALTRM